MKKLNTMISMFIVLVLIVGCSPKGVPNAKNWQINDFTYTNQENKQFGLQDLKGKVWIADFVFTNCTSVCPPMTANMSKLQKKLKDEGIKDVELISFSIDPETDTPEVLKDYGRKYNADFSNWHFLTGYSQAEIEKFAQEDFKAFVKKPESDDQVIHGTDFYLVDQNGKIIQYYTGLADIPMDEIVKHIKILQNY
ncbi:SCO family protein [Peribacillus acanthi]|uniref:SCO family protein n=1 Tax=Peribacillus acanthi TaxID=2171554 RepID=UPI000D3E4F25|nr:SCO family protein [Peribacillus acanthi]